MTAENWIDFTRFFKLSDKVLQNPEIDRFELPDLKLSLLPHQIYAAYRMMIGENIAQRGGILGDVMGLGKTLIAITVVEKSQGAWSKCIKWQKDHGFQGQHDGYYILLVDMLNSRRITGTLSKLVDGSPEASAENRGRLNWHALRWISQLGMFPKSPQDQKEELSNANRGIERKVL